jgi:hypothetical protein
MPKGKKYVAEDVGNLVGLSDHQVLKYARKLFPEHLSGTPWVFTSTEYKQLVKACRSGHLA